MKLLPFTGTLMLATTLLISAEEAAKKADAPAAAESAAPAAPAVSPETMKKNSSYGFGFQNGRQFAQQVGRFGIGSADIDNAEFVRGFAAAMAGKELEV
ncbi:MAG: hypothetical protein EAZ81_10440, partial [Verrucomicrobia bacterium]